MSKLKKSGTIAGVAISGTAYIVLMILGLLLHLWTIIVALSVKGILAAIFTLALPILAQIYWFFKAWSISGTLLNPYCLGIFAYIGLWIIVIIGILIIGVSASD